MLAITSLKIHVCDFYIHHFIFRYDTCLCILFVLNAIPKIVSPLLHIIVLYTPPPRFVVINHNFSGVFHTIFLIPAGKARAFNEVFREL